MNGFFSDFVGAKKKKNTNESQYSIIRRKPNQRVDDGFEVTETDCLLSLVNTAICDLITL